MDSRDLRCWCFELIPVVILVYEAERHRGFWLPVQDYIERNPGLMDLDAETVTLRIPTRNKLDLRAIDRFRQLSLDCVSRIRKRFENRP